MRCWSNSFALSQHSSLEFLSRFQYDLPSARVYIIGCHIAQGVVTPRMFSESTSTLVPFSAGGASFRSRGYLATFSGAVVTLCRITPPNQGFHQGAQRESPSVRIGSVHRLKAISPGAAL
jgi:hypothetical protein